jgi:hypothetical protein
MHSLTTGASWRWTIVAAAALTSIATTANVAAAQSRRDPANGIPGKPESQQASFESYAKDLGFGYTAGSMRYDGSVKCPDPAKCGGQSSVELSIVPSDYVDDWDGAVKGTKNGHIVAKVFNAGHQPFGYWNLTADDALSYIWIGQFQGGRGAALYAIRNGKLTRIYTFAGIKKCTKTAGPPEVHFNMPASCTEPIGALPERNVQLAALPTEKFMAQFYRAQGVQVNGLWVSCSAGCCEVQYSLD